MSLAALGGLRGASAWRQGGERRRCSSHVLGPLCPLWNLGSAAVATFLGHFTLIPHGLHNAPPGLSWANFLLYFEPSSPRPAQPERVLTQRPAPGASPRFPSSATPAYDSRTRHSVLGLSVGLPPRDLGEPARLSRSLPLEDRPRSTSTSGSTGTRGETLGSRGTPRLRSPLAVSRVAPGPDPGQQHGPGTLPTSPAAQVDRAAPAEVPVYPQATARPLIPAMPKAEPQVHAPSVEAQFRDAVQAAYPAIIRDVQREDQYNTGFISRWGAGAGCRAMYALGSLTRATLSLLIRTLQGLSQASAAKVLLQDELCSF